MQQVQYVHKCKHIHFANTKGGLLVCNKYVRSTVCRYSTRYAIYTPYLLTSIGHRFGHQSGLDESSGRNSTTCLHGIAFRVYLVFSKIDKNTKP